MKAIFKSFIIFIVLGSFLSSCSDDDKNEPDVEKTPEFVISPKSITMPLSLFFGSRIMATLDGEELDMEKVKWHSENPEIALCEEDDLGGVIWPKSPGETNIVATLISDGRTVKCKVIVVDKNKYKLRLTLKDKGNSQYSISNPSEFLSAKAIARRNKYSIPVNEQDLPISADYIKKIEEVGGKVVVESKWLKTVTIYCENEDLSAKYLELPFVEKAEMVWVEYPAEYNPEIEKSAKAILSSADIPDIYGAAKTNISVNNGYPLHEAGFKGQGIDIAVIDGGFANLQTNPKLDNIKIKGAKSFVYEDKDPYNADEHGVWVLSTMATNKPNEYIGVAPEANYWLLRTEDDSGEYPVEEDYWVAALEFADSVGVALVNTSLYYTTFDYSYRDMSYISQNMDGKTAYSTRAANIAADKGILIVCCSGNHQDWVGTPADSPKVLAVGSVSSNKTVGTFTAWGMTADGRIKPDVMSLGSSAYVINIEGWAETRSGSSYASPITCGLVACLWQAYPQLTNKEILEIMKKSADKYNAPELPYGYGIPDMEKAMSIAAEVVGSK